MKLVQVADDGAVELKWMWLPTFIGQNYPVMKQLEKAWKEKFNGQSADDGVLWQIHYFTIDWLAEKFPIPGLKDYLSAIEKVQQ